MASVLYLVLRSREKWWVDMEGKSLGPFESPDIATFAAIDAARVRGDVNSAERQVYVEQPGRKFTMIWSSTHPPEMEAEAKRA